MIKYVVFDWDGTLVNTIPFLKQTFEETFKYLNLPPIPYYEIQDIASQCGGQGLFIAIFKDKAKDAKSFFYEYTQKYHLELLETFSGAEEVIKYCQNNGLICNVLSNKKSDVLKKEVEYLGWNKYFNKISGAGEYYIDKPAKEPCFALFNNMIPKSDEILVVGDSMTDIKMAEVWSCPCVIIKPNNNYTYQNIKYNIESLSEIIPLLQSMLY